VLNGEGVIILEKAGTRGIPPEIDHLLKDRKSWEEHYLPRLQFSEDRVLKAKIRVGGEMIPFNEGGLDYLRRDGRDYPFGLHCGSLFGRVRNIVGITGSTYIYAEDEALFDEMINTYGDLCYRCVKMALESGAKFDFAHFWEDICFKNGPLISPIVFDEKVGPHYRRITELARSYGVNIVSLDCDGLIDALIPTWFNNGVNTMFPIEVGTWNASIAPWRARFGKELRGVGGMNKNVLAHDFDAVDAEIERLRQLVDLGGFIPCPDHRLAPDAKWDNVRYYCDRMREVFG
jgi:uroporphyrinogen decarboxylase